MSTVFVNGCFDLLHIGHVRLLQFAKRFGDRLVIGLNSDSSVRSLKGQGRPIIPESERLQMLYAVGANDVVVFNEPTPFELVVVRRPDVLVVGCHHSPTCRSCDYVRDYGGQVAQAPAFDEVSTSAIIERIRAT